ncbi:MAG: FtsX-like permease family protein [Bdellovibrionota bacterium]
MNVLRVAWRNLWRNGRRTVITLAAVAFSTAVLTITVGLMHGMIRNALRNATNLYVGEAEIHAAKYMEEHSFYESISDAEGILARVRGQGIDGTARSYGYGLVASGTKSAGALFWGLNPEDERRVFDLSRYMAKGEFLDGGAKSGIVLGQKLARSLQADLGSEIVVVVEAADGSLGNELFTVTGILKTVGEGTDRSAALLHREDFDRLFVGGGRVHELAFNTRGAVPENDLAAALEKIAPGEEVRGWRKLLPVLSDMMNMFDAILWIFGGVFFLSAGLGVLNTMLMATHERVREFGCVKALGASPWRIIRDVAVEALVLGVISSALGGVLGLWGCRWIERHGIDTSALAKGTQMAGIAFDPVWRAVTDPAIAFRTALVMSAVCLVASLYPAVLAARLQPVQAMQRV